MTPAKPPAAAPCVSCPYRRDVPSGLWAPDEYEKLPAYDRETAYQPLAAFSCHQNDGRVCAGWAHLADRHTLALRISVRTGRLTRDLAEQIVEYRSPVPCFDSHAEAAEHGLTDVAAPGPKAAHVIKKMTRKRASVPTTTSKKEV